MSKEAEGIVRAQLDLYGRISRAYENLKKAGAANITIGLVEARLQTLESYWGRFETQHEMLVKHHWEALVGQEYQTQDLPALVEEAYLQQKGMFLDALRTLRSRAEAESSVPVTDASSSAHPARTALPRIQLPQFSGQYEDWPPFRDLFNSLVGTDESVSPVEKLHYLKSCLKGEAELLIRCLPTTGENFDRAWKSLTDYYENKRLLVRSYLSRFTSLPKLKGESASELRGLYHCVMNTVGALESIGRPISSGEDLFVHLVVELLDPRSRREWENLVSETQEPPSYVVLRQFIDRRLHTLESLQPVKGEVCPVKPGSGSARQTRALNVKGVETKRGRCSMCRRDHFIMFCDVYRGKTAEEKKRHVEANNLCLNCLGRHRLNECSSMKTCSSCGSRHHTTLHDACFVGEAARVSHVARGLSRPPAAVLLATARIRVADRFGSLHAARALIDQGSESSLISESLVQRLRVTRSPASVSVFGVGGRLAGVARGSVDLRISARGGGLSMAVSALVLPRITLYDGGVRAERRRWAHLDGLELADPEFLAADPVDILLGADVYADILLEGWRRGESREPVAQRTRLGWILSGAVGGRSAVLCAQTYTCRCEGELPDLVQRFWRQEEMVPAPLVFSREEQACEEFFRSTHTRDAEGRYVVRIPVVASLPDLTETRRSAVRAFEHLERRFARDESLRQLYSQFMQQYEELGHMAPIPPGSPDAGAWCYLPHHGVMRESDSSAKIRVVFNGSSAVSSRETLNRHLLVGPNLLPALADVLLRWRVHRYALATDIEKMFRQILVDPEDRDLQRIVWRYNSAEVLQEYRLNTVTYGLACAPFLAMRTLRQLADDEEARFPRGAAVLREGVYMDDILTGASSIAEARELQRQLQELCMAGGFPLRKWAASDGALLAAIPVEHRRQRDILSWRPQESHATLGLRWHPSGDSFSFSTQSIELSTVTKRSVLSLTARLFDPLGWLAPVVVRAKIWFQSTWLQGRGWDFPLSDSESRLWQEFRADLKRLEDIRVPRWLPLVGSIQLHGFADASERAYAAVVYVRSDTFRGPHRVGLVAAKTRVAPLRPVSLPRLELSAAALLVRLTAHVQQTINIKGAPVHLWSDSTVALAWIRGHPSRWKTYVANRVSDIQTTLPTALWHHLPGQDNPADCASRGISPGELIGHPLWWRGPPWLLEGEETWPTSPGPPIMGDLPEERMRSHVAAVRLPQVDEPAELTRFSSLRRLVRVTAWCRRWLRRRKAAGPPADRSPWPETILSASECEVARGVWIRMVQSLHYGAERKAISRGEFLPSRGSLAGLTPFVDSEGIFRVGGRLKHSLLAFDERHPVILPGRSHFTRLVIEACHRQTLHGGVQLTLGLIRRRYWIPRGRSLVKAAIWRCVSCVRWRAATPHPLMSGLPQRRVTPSRPFLHTGVDYAGPILLRTAKGRGHRAYKAFIAVFVCFSTRAVHLEVVSDYTAEAFLAALRRFTSRRGLCRSLHSDCGTNFVGADAQLRGFFAASSPERCRVAGQLAEEGIRWIFNPPSAPHFGGLWEAAVKSLKHHLRRVLDETTLTYEEMSTLLAQIEACLNSRPLQALSDDPDDLAALTPGHFLIGSALNALPGPDLSEAPDCRLTRWQLLQRMRDHFWERWSHEYLHSLVRRPKWTVPSEQVRVGRLCLLRSENTPPTRWPLARVTRVHPGEDGHVRVVTVRTAASELTRPIVKIVLLPVSDSGIWKEPAAQT